MSAFRRRWAPFLGGVVVAVAVVFGTLFFVTQTDPGRERILAVTLDAMGGQLSEGSELVVERLEGGLFTGARMYGITLRDPEGRTMVAADSAFIRYRLASFFGGDVVINELVLHQSDVLLYRLPGDSLWNYQAVLQDTLPEEPGKVGRATVIHALRLLDARVTIRLPWEPDDDLPPAERAREVAAALSDTSRLDVERVAGGFLRTIVVRTPDVALESLTVAPDERGGTYLRVAQGSATVDLYRDEPLHIQALQGELGLREGVVRYTAPLVELPESRLTSAGVLDMSGEDPRYDVRVTGLDVALRDVQWLYPSFPDEGEASFELDLETRADELFMRMTDLEMEARGTRLVGDFSLLMGERMLFSDVSLRADPLDMATVERMLPVDIPVRGLQIGALEIETPAS